MEQLKASYREANLVLIINSNSFPIGSPAMAPAISGEQRLSRNGLGGAQSAKFCLIANIAV